MFHVAFFSLSPFLCPYSLLLGRPFLLLAEVLVSELSTWIKELVDEIRRILTQLLLVDNAILLAWVESRHRACRQKKDSILAYELNLWLQILAGVVCGRSRNEATYEAVTCSLSLVAFSLVGPWVLVSRYSICVVWKYQFG